MRDLAQKWSIVPNWQTAVIEGPALTIRSLLGLSQCLVSGNLDAWSQMSGISASGVGAFGRVAGDSYAVQVSRDRLLVISVFGPSFEPGWHPQGFAVTELGAGLHVFQMEGADIPEMIARATPLDPSIDSPSAALSFGGINAVAYYHSDTKLRVHADRGLATYLWTWMSVTAGSLAAARNQAAE